MYLAFIGVFAIEVVLGFNLAFTFGFALYGLWAASGIDELAKSLLAIRKFRSRIKALVATQAK